MEWKAWGKCIKCQTFLREIKFGDRAMLAVRLGKMCPHCGTELESGNIATVPRRFISESVWWRPWTWNRGYWETKKP